VTVNNYSTADAVVFAFIVAEAGFFISKWMPTES